MDGNSFLEIFEWWETWQLLDVAWETSTRKAGKLFEPFLSGRPPHVPRATQRLELAYDLFLRSKARTEFLPPDDWSGGPPDVELPGGVTTYGHEAEVLRSISNIFYEERPEVWDLSQEGWLAHTDCSQVMLASGSSNTASRAVLGVPKAPIFAPQIGDRSFRLKYSIGMGSGRAARLQYGQSIERDAMAIWSDQGKPIVQAERQGVNQTDDYLLVTRIPGPTPDSVFTVLAGLHGPGTRSAELLFTGVDPNELEDLASRIGHKSGEVSYFQAVFRASKFYEIGKSDVANRLQLVTEECPPVRIEAFKAIRTLRPRKIAKSKPSFISSRKRGEFYPEDQGSTTPRNPPSIQAITKDGETIEVRVNGHQFNCEQDTGEAIIPKTFLTGFRLSDIPVGIVIKPVEAVDGHTIHIKNDFGLSHHVDGAVSAFVEEMFRRKFWDGDVGLSPYVAALRQAIIEQGDISESDFQDDGDYVFLHYEINIAENLEVQDAIQNIDAMIGRLKERAYQIVSRRRDPLIGLFDRGSFDADLTYALRNSKQGAALVMADIDHFKTVNDTYGHPVGDSVLRAVAQALAARCDSRNRVAYRYGGEELAVVLTGATAEEATKLAESVRADIQKLEVVPGLKVTISLGVATTLEGGDRADLVKQADEALYQAKRDGRNCVRIAEQPR